MSVRFSNCPLYSGLASRKWHLKVKVTVSSHHGAVFNYSPIWADSQYGSEASPGTRLTLSTLSIPPWQPTPLQGRPENCTPREAQSGILSQTDHWLNYKCLDDHFASHMSPRPEKATGKWTRYSKVQHFKMRRQTRRKKEIQNQQIQREGVRCVYLFHLHLIPWGRKYLFSVFWM